MDAAEIEESLVVVSDAKLHGGMCKVLSLIVYKVLEIFPFIEASRPRSKSGIQALCSLHVALDKAKTLLKHCSDCSKLYLAITGDSVLMKFERARCALQESLRRVEDIVPESIGCQLLEIVCELEGAVFELDQLEKEVGDDIISLLQKERHSNTNPNSSRELEVFHQAALKLGITSSRAALTERRALKKLIERAQNEEDKRKESIVSYLLHLMRKYSKLFRSDVGGDDTDSQGSSPCSPTFLSTSGSPGGQRRGAFERHISKLAYSFKNVPATPPEEFRCPISLQLMYDPVIISSGQTYERSCIEKWFRDGHSTCPRTQQQLAHLGLTPNYCVKGLIASWCEQNGISVPDRPPESLDIHSWRLASKDYEAMESGSAGTVDSCMMKGVKIVPVEENGFEETKWNDLGSTNTSCQDFEGDGLGRCEDLLAILYEGKSMKRQRKAVEQIRFLLKDDKEARIYMGANGAVEALVHFLKLAIDGGDDNAQEIGSMALFNLSVNNNRNKELLLSHGVIPLLDHMISNPATEESATALFLNLSSLDDAKPVIASTPSLPFIVQLLDSHHTQSKHDAIFTLYNLSTHHSSIQPLLNSGIISALHALISDEGSLSWVEKALAILINLAQSNPGSKEIVSTPGLVAAIAAVLDIGELPEQEQAVACLLILCSGDEKCSETVLKEGVVPGLVSVSVNGRARGREKAEKLLQLFREQRKQEQVDENSCGGSMVKVAEHKALCKTKSRFGRSLSSMWKKKSFSVYQC